MLNYNGQMRGCSFICSEEPELVEAKFYCLQHDMFLCKNCFDEHLGHRGADSIKNHLAKDFSKWSNMQNRIEEISQRLDNNAQRYKDLIDILRDYYQSENTNPGGFVFANSTGTYSATNKNYTCVQELKGIQTSNSPLDFQMEQPHPPQIRSTTMNIHSSLKGKARNEENADAQNQESKVNEQGTALKADEDEKDGKVETEEALAQDMIEDHDLDIM